MNQDEYDALVRKWDNFEYRSGTDFFSEMEYEEWKSDAKVLLIDHENIGMVTLFIPKVNQAYSIEFFNLIGDWIGNSGWGIHGDKRKIAYHYEVRFIGVK